MLSFFITFAGWWAWNAFLSGIYPQQPSPYAVRGGFLSTFGRDPLWWLTLIITVIIFILVEMVYKTVKHNLVVAKLWRWPPWKGRVAKESEGEFFPEEWDLDLWQEMEQDPVIKGRLERILEDEELGYRSDEDIDVEDLERRGRE